MWAGLTSIGDWHRGLSPLGQKWVLAGLIVAVTVSMLAVTRPLVRRLLQRQADVDPIAVSMVGRLVQVVVAAVGLELVLHVFGVSLTTIMAAGGVAAIAIGFASKSIVENFISGAALRLGRTIKKGDIIILQDRWLIVDRIGLRNMIARSYEDEDVIIPNSLLTQSIVRNLTRHDRLYRIRVDVAVAYESDWKHVRKTLEDLVEKLEFRSDARESEVYLDGFGESSVNYSVRVWIDDANQALGCKSKLREQVWEALNRENITIAFPQLDVHVGRRPKAD